MIKAKHVFKIAPAQPGGVRVQDFIRQRFSLRVQYGAFSAFAPDELQLSAVCEAYACGNAQLPGSWRKESGELWGMPNRASLSARRIVLFPASLGP